MGKVLTNSFICDCMRTGYDTSNELLSRIRGAYAVMAAKQLEEEARKDKIVPYIAHALMQAGCDIDFWKPIHEQYENRNREVIQLLIDLYEAFDRAGLKNVVVSENFGSVLSSDACLGCFCSGDVDFYCWDIDLDKLDKVLTSFGFSWSDRHTRKKSFAREYKGENAIGEEFWLNFQWKPMTRKKTHLYDQRRIIARYPSFFEMTEYYKDTKIKLFKPECNVYLNCIHIASGHYYILTPGLRLYADIDRPARSRKIDWMQVRRWIEEDRLGMRSDLVLKISERMLGTPIPTNAYTPLVSSIRFDRMINRLIDWDTKAFNRPQGKLNYILFLIRVELSSDGRNRLIAFLNRLYVIAVGKD